MTPAPIVLTSGEPAGVGLELSFLAWRELFEETCFFLLADRDHAAKAAGKLPLREITAPDEAPNAMREGLPLLHQPFAAPNHFGRPNIKNAPCVIDTIRRAVDLVTTGHASAIVTNPIHKKALKDGAGFAFPGHTEFLAHLADVPRSVMMLSCPGLRVVPVTIHIPLGEVAGVLTPALLRETLEITHSALVGMFDLPNPRIAVGGLNPHAGEGGAMGAEEIGIMSPVIRALQKTGMNIVGPLAADTMFHADARREYDVAVMMYHDQALIPIKTLDFFGGTNITLGLPFVRTSPDHGTALDLAGKHRANPASLIAALREAKNLAAHSARKS